MPNIERIQNTSDLTPLREEWNQLARTTLTSAEWLWSWWEAYGAPHELFVLPVRDQGELVALAPWYRETTASGALAIKSLASGKACTDYQTILAKEGFEDAASQALTNWLIENCGDENHGWDRLELESVSSEDRIIASFIEQCQQNELQVAVKPTDACWVFEFGATWDEYFARIKKNIRQKLRRLKRDYSDVGRAALVELAPGEDIGPWFDRLVELHQARWSSVDVAGCFSTPEFERFLRQAVTELHAKERVWMPGLEIDGELVGVALYLVDDRTIRLYQVGVDPQRRNDQVGWQLNHLVLQAAFAKGVQCVDFLRGEEDYKRYLGARPVPQVSYRVAAPRSTSILRHQLWATKDWLRDWSKQLRATSESS